MSRARRERPVRNTFNVGASAGEPSPHPLSPHLLRGKWGGARVPGCARRNRRRDARFRPTLPPPSPLSLAPGEGLGVRVSRWKYESLGHFSPSVRDLVCHVLERGVSTNSRHDEDAVRINSAGVPCRSWEGCLCSPPGPGRRGQEKAPAPLSPVQGAQVREVQAGSVCFGGCAARAGTAARLVIARTDRIVSPALPAPLGILAGQGVPVPLRWRGTAGAAGVP